MKKQLTPYQEADRLIKHDAIIDIANLIDTNARLLEALKDMILYLDNNDKEADVSEFAREAIKLAEDINP